MRPTPATLTSPRVAGWGNVLFRAMAIRRATEGRPVNDEPISRAEQRKSARAEECRAPHPVGLACNADGPEASVESLLYLG